MEPLKQRRLDGTGHVLPSVLTAAAAFLVCGCPADKPSKTADGTPRPATAATDPDGEIQQGAKDGAAAGGTAASPQLNLHSIVHPREESWKVVEENKDRIVLMGRPGDVHYLSFHEGDTDLPLNDLDDLRKHVRKTAAAEHGGIIQVDRISVQGRDAVLYLTKEVRPEIQGYRYVARCVIPARDCWYEVRMGAVEMGPTGGREAAVTTELLRDKPYETEPVPPEAPPTPGPPQTSPNPQRMKGWFRDPYDPQFDALANFTVSDEARYDELFPEHPLTRVRQRFPQILESLEFSKDFVQ